MPKNGHFLTRLSIAFSGLITAFKEERNFRIQTFIAGIVIIAMVALGLNSIEKSMLIIMGLVVLSLELINSQIEKFLDILHPDHHPRVKIIKDFSAGAVLLSAIGSMVVGLLIFLPHILFIFDIIGVPKVGYVIIK